MHNVSKNIPNTADVALEEEQEGSRLHHLNEQWQTGLKEVQKINGFKTFLLSKRMETLWLAAANGPVVILNASERDCAALVLKSAEADVLHVPLPQFRPDTAKKLARKMYKLVNVAHPRVDDDRSIRHLPIMGDDEDIFCTLDLKVRSY